MDKRKTTKIIILFTLLLILLIPACNPKVVNQMKLQIDVKPDYQSGEDINVVLLLANDGEDSILVNKRMAINIGQKYLGEVSFIITAPSGEDIYWVVRLDYPYTTLSDFVELKPGESITQSYTLNQYFAPFDEMGKYSIQAVYYNYSQPDDGRTAWTGEIRSDIVHFTVNP